jgi:SAM-dependent methyltransferase
MEHKLRDSTAQGLVLDLGGGESNNAQKMQVIPGTRMLTTDIRLAAKPQFVSNCEVGLPLRAGGVDTVLLLNVLEHIYYHQELVAEIGRVLKPGGILYLYVPFLFHRHTARHPAFFVDDYFRYGPGTLKRLLVEHGGFTGPFELEACGYGPCTASASLIAAALPWHWMSVPLHWAGAIGDRIFFVIMGDSSTGISASEWPIAYWLKAIK